ncbi:MAG TPA: nicotinate-nucleotide adenylyltransferase [Desulfohalobiaceae bacterium]|nr:nicotinate-nucleotide adenylyltransferase [Desulfohalobiaceae bacterium]
MKIGILGGSFNPVHNGHLRLAIEAQELIGLDRVDLVPAAVPPHKASVHMLSFDFRLILLRLAVTSCSQILVNDLEGSRPGPSYTVDTLRAYKNIYPEDDFYFLLGSQDLMTLPSWREWKTLISLTNLVVVWRNGSDMDELDKFVQSHLPQAKQVLSSCLVWSLPFDKQIITLQIPLLEISSTLVRNKWQQGLSLSYLVPEAVEKALKEYKPNEL